MITINKHIIISSIYSDTISFLIQNHIPHIIFDPCFDVSDPICGHADLFCHFLLERDVIVYHKCTDLIQKLSDLSYNVLVSDNTILLDTAYPFDVLFNAFRINNHLFCNTNFILPQILQYYYSHNVYIHHVNQGYTNCSCLKITDNAMITNDAPIHMAALGLGINSLLISSNSILLPPYPHGFFGGCGALICDKVLFLTGHYSSSPDCSRIHDFLALHHVTPVFGNSPSLLDLGIVGF